MFEQYKDAFFSANPTFQWYKLPAPPLRTLTTITRPSNAAASTHGDAEFGNRSTAASASANNVGMFKFADAAQMGGLNDLMHVREARSPVISPAAVSQLSKERSEADKKSKSNRLQI